MIKSESVNASCLRFWRCTSTALLLLSVLLPMLSCSSDHTPAEPFEIPPFEARAIGHTEVAVGYDATHTLVHKVLFIAIDGLRANKLDNTDGHNLTIPNFKSMQDNGVFVYESHQEKVPPYGKYETCPGFIQMTTGKRIEAHGVKNNDDCREGDFGNYPIFFKRLKELRPNIRIGFADNTKQVVEILEESCRDVPNLCIDDEIMFLETYEGDIAGRNKILEWMQDGSYDVLWYHPHEIDRIGHSSGWDDDPINDMVEKYDKELIRPLLDGIATREATTPERWMIITTADHGGHNAGWPWWWGDHNTEEPKDMQVPIIVSGTLIRNEGNRGLNAFNTWDLPATIFNYLNLTPDPSWPATDGTPIVAEMSPILNFSPKSITFGQIPIGDIQTRPITIKNNMGVDVSVSFSASTSGAFTWREFNKTIVDGDQAMVFVNFSPISNQSFQKIITITSSAPNSPHIISLSGRGLGGVNPL